MDDWKAKAKSLIAIADTDLERLWKNSPVVMGGLTLGNREAGTAYVKIAAAWLAEANQTLGNLDESDPDTVIDQLGQRLDLVVERRTRLFQQGMGLDDPLSEGMKTFVTTVQARIKGAYDTVTDPKVLTLAGIGVVLVLAAIVALRL